MKDNISKIVYKGKSEKGQEIIIRYPQKGDAQAMCDYINTLSKEKTFISFQGEQLTLKEETKYLNDQLKKFKEKQAVQLLVFSNDKLIGNSQIDMKDRATKHEGVFGISLAKGYRGEGIGKKLMSLLLTQAKKNIPQIRIVTLSIFANNSSAMSLYKKMGFKVFGTLPAGVLHKGKYVDHIFMYKKLRA